MEEKELYDDAKPLLAIVVAIVIVLVLALVRYHAL